MKMLFLLLFLASCTSSEIEKKVIQPEKQLSTPIKFMSEIEVKESFAYKGQKASKNLDHINHDSDNRMFTLIPENKFFTPGQMAKKKKKSKQQVYQAKGKADLRLADSPIENQWDGTCTAHALRNIIDNKSGARVSTRHIWSKYKVYSCESAINAWNGQGCITNESSWPHDMIAPSAGYSDPRTCKTYLKSAIYIDDDLDKMKESLDNGNPVYLGISVTNSMLNCDTTLLPTSKSTSGGHALAIVGYKDDDNIRGGGYFIIKNSWGIDCGDRGYQYVPYYHCKRKDMYCVMWAIEKVDITKKDTNILPEKECLKWKRIWWKFGKLECVEWGIDKGD